jgi:hypothetical protein
MNDRFTAETLMVRFHIIAANHFIKKTRKSADSSDRRSGESSARIGPAGPFPPKPAPGNLFGIIRAYETSAALRALIIDGAPVGDQEFAAVFQDQLTPAGEGKIKALGA